MRNESFWQLNWDDLDQTKCIIIQSDDESAVEALLLELAKIFHKSWINPHELFYDSSDSVSPQWQLVSNINLLPYATDDHITFCNPSASQNRMQSQNIPDDTRVVFCAPPSLEQWNDFLNHCFGNCNFSEKSPCPQTLWLAHTYLQELRLFQKVLPYHEEELTVDRFDLIAKLMESPGLINHLSQTEMNQLTYSCDKLNQALCIPMIFREVLPNSLQQIVQKKQNASRSEQDLLQEIYQRFLKAVAQSELDSAQTLLQLWLSLWAK
ncbi:MAG: hypothetical protein FJ161_00105 [Gammaproteobacteria bacterium]|nr:hypothetical protein [Gammaproteobacteria bacterium]